MVPNVEADDELRGRIVGHKVQGLGISNMKGGLASLMMAGKALKKSGIKLKGAVDALRGTFIHFHQFSPMLGPIVIAIMAVGFFIVVLFNFRRS